MAQAFNINNEVYFIPTSEGMAVLSDKGVICVHKSLGESRLCKLSFWEFANTFGEQFSIGSNNQMIKDNQIYFSDPTKEGL